MIIEIDKRQVGKTKRLVEHAFNFLLKSDKDILIVSYNLNASSLIKSKIEQKLRNHFFKSIDYDHYDYDLYKHTHKIVNNYCKRIKYSTSTWVKEKKDIGFYYIDEISFIKKDKIQFLDNAYYTGLSYDDLFSIGWNIIIDYYEIKHNDKIIELLYQITTKKYKRNYKIESIFEDKENNDLYNYTMNKNVGINDKFKSMPFKKIYR